MLLGWLRSQGSHLNSHSGERNQYEGSGEKRESSLSFPANLWNGFALLNFNYAQVTLPHFCLVSGIELCFALFEALQRLSDGPCPSEGNPFNVVSSAQPNGFEQEYHSSLGSSMLRKEVSIWLDGASLPRKSWETCEACRLIATNRCSRAGHEPAVERGSISIHAPRLGQPVRD